MTFTTDFINIYIFICMMITKYLRAMMERNDFPKLSSPSKAGWINSILISMHDDY